MIDEERQMRPGSEVHLDEWVTRRSRTSTVHPRRQGTGVMMSSGCSRPRGTAGACRHRFDRWMELQKPIRVGERLAMTASVAFTSPRSIGVRLRCGMERRTMRRLPARWLDYMTFVALDDEGKPLPSAVPAGNARRSGPFREGRLRSEFRKKMLSGQLPDSGCRECARAGEPALHPRAAEVPARSLKLPFERGRVTGERHGHPRTCTRSSHPRRQAELPRHAVRRHPDALDRVERASSPRDRICTATRSGWSACTV